MMTLKTFTIIALTSVIAVSASAQIPSGIQWQQRFGGGGTDSARAIRQTTDGGYIIGGDSNSGASGNKTNDSFGNYDFWIVKVNAMGEKQWEKSFGGNGFDQLYALEQTTDGGYILGGFSDSPMSGNKANDSFGGYDYWVIKVDAEGNKVWEKSFGGTGGDYLFSLQQTTDGGYILGGQSASGATGNKTNLNFGNFDYWVVKIDGNGNKQWEQVYGGSGEDYFASLQQTTDGGYILGGGSISPISGNKTNAGFGSFDYWVVKIDENGTKQWEQSFGGTGSDDFAALLQTVDGGYLLGGYADAGISGNKSNAGFGLDDYWLVKIDAVGVKQWEQTFGGTNNETLFSLKPTSDGGYVLGGSSVSEASGNKTSTSFGNHDYWVVKVNATGEKQWEKAFGGGSIDKLFSLQQANDGGYILAGQSASGISGNKTSNSFGEFDYWIIKFGTPLRFNSFSIGADQVFHGQLAGNAETDYVFQASTNLIDWTSLQTNSSPNGFVTFSDTNASGFPARFYRAVEEP